CYWGLPTPVAAMKRPHSKSPLPSKDDIVAFIGQQPGKVGTREIARAFDLRNADRDGELIAVPTEWDEAEHGPAPKIRIRIPRRPRPNEVAGIGDRVLLRVEDSGDKNDAVHHTARIIKLIDRAVSLIAIHAHSIPNVFPAAAVAEAEAAKPARLAGREDWRDIPLITIDPADAKDHDDAVHATRDDDPKNPGGFVISIAIADVAHYVRPGSALDGEALVRGNSVYFPDQVVPMLPERISNDLCSLRPGE